MKPTPDIVSAMLALIRTTVAITEEQAQSIEQKIRHEWGGEQVTVQKRAPLMEAKKQRAAADAGHKSKKQICEEQGISRATLYRCLAERKKND